MRLILATANLDKYREIKGLLKGLNLEIISLNNLPKKINIKEDGKTFYENAYRKAFSVSKLYKNDLVIGEDSGLEVAYLNNQPGVYSHRYAGKNPTYLDNNLKLLKALNGVPRRKRRACFCCVIVLMRNKEVIRAFEGKLRGYINEHIVGRGGFGYDPIFYLPSYKKTVAQLSLREKNKISHRARAFNKLKRFLQKAFKTR